MTSKIHQVNETIQQDLWNLLKDLYSIPRTIMGKGFEDSLALIKKIVPIEPLTFPTGTAVESWTIPSEWHVHSAIIETLDGETVLDYDDNAMHLWQYSVPVDIELSREDLEGHLSTAINSHDSIPHTVTFYNEQWGFSLSESQKNKLTDKRYRVKINTSFTDGVLSIGQIVIPGKVKEEVLIDAVLSCPSLGNNLTGPVIACFLAQKLLKRDDRYFSYRIVFTPETIGPLVLCNLVDKFADNIVGGYTLVNLGDANYFNYKRSRAGNTVADHAMEHSLFWSNMKYKVKEFDVRTGSCGNEKAYNSLGCEVPIGAIHRSPLGSYPEYDTSSDDLSFVNKKQLIDSFRVCQGAIETLERSQIFQHTFKGEPFLTGYGLYPKIEKDEERIPYDYLMSFTTGKMTLVDIANRANLCVGEFDAAVKQMLNVGLIE
ncbi:MAG: DUF4910 domain-containing protein [Gammaproteobacteria bacterium]|nr:DUF4910 domain-containing protein [Gammaproteobacteria bacterium]